jgi:hypothetical protein
MNENSIFDKLENYEQKIGVNYFAAPGNVNGIDGLWATYLLDKNYMMTGFFNEDKLMYLSLENNVSVESNPAFFLEGGNCSRWTTKPKIDLLERSFCLELMAQNKKPLLEGLNPEKLDVFALDTHIRDNVDNLRGMLTETCLKDPNTPISKQEMVAEMPFIENKTERDSVFSLVKSDMLRFILGKTEEIGMRFFSEKTLSWQDVKLDRESVGIKTSEKNPILQYNDGECEVVLTKGQGKYEVETRKADLEYAGAEPDPDYHDVVSSEASACLAFSKRCAELAKNAGRNDSAAFLVQRVAYKKAQEILLGGRTGNGGESLSPPKPKKKTKIMERQ